MPGKNQKPGKGGPPPPLEKKKTAEHMHSHFQTGELLKAESLYATVQASVTYVLNDMRKN